MRASTEPLVTLAGDRAARGGELADRAAVERAGAGVHTVVHLGACPSMPGEFRCDRLKPNVEGLWHRLDASRLAGVKRFVFASTSAVAFGAKEAKQLTTETRHVFNPYGAVLGRWFYDEYRMEFLAVRIGYFSGGYAEPALADPFLNRVWLGPRDCGRFFQLAVTALQFGYGIVYARSRTPGNHFDLTSARTLLGYEPEEEVPVGAQGTS